MKTNTSQIPVLILVALITGCSPANPPAAEAPTGKIAIRGSNTFGEELAPALIAAYKKDHPGAVFDLESKGTSYGFGLLAGGYCDIAGASRTPSKDELEVSHLHDVEFKDHIIGAYSVAVIVNSANPASNLTKEQVRDIFSGAVTNWNAVGGSDLPIHLFIRDPISGTFIGFKELAMEKKEYAHSQKLCTNYTGIAESVAQDPAGIGYSSFGLTKNPGVKAISIGGVAPSAEAVNKGDYPYARTLHLYTSNQHESPEALAFIQFVTSAPGQKVLAEAGDTPLAASNP